MRHQKSGRKLGRTYSHKKATLANIALAIFEHKSIITTTPKAKEARTTVERIITFAKKGDVAARREGLRTIRNKDLVKQIFEDIAPKYAERKGGYTRIVKLGNRSGDNADMAIFELVGYEGLKQEKIEKQRQKRQEKKKKDQKEAEATAKEAEKAKAREEKEK